VAILSFAMIINLLMGADARGLRGQRGTVTPGWIFYSGLSFKATAHVLAVL